MIRALEHSDREPVAAFYREHWGSDRVVSQGRMHRVAELSGFVALSDDGNGIEGLVTFLIEGDRCEVVTLDAVEQGRGTGTALLERAVEAARAAGCRHVLLVTTNDNMRALRFYQRRGFRLVALNAGALDRSRELKPEIPATGMHGIPLSDELVLAREI
jgi:ribosomal protein S18 acetylase RimI-like enzyme